MIDKRQIVQSAKAGVIACAGSAIAGLSIAWQLPPNLSWIAYIGVGFMLSEIMSAVARVRFMLTSADMMNAVEAMKNDLL